MSQAQNHLLASLPSARYECCFRILKMIQIRKNEILSEPGKRSGIVYFPVDCVISIYHILESGESTEIAMIGNEGMYDITRVLGGAGMPYIALAQTTGHAFIIDSHFLKQELDRDESIAAYLAALCASSVHTNGSGGSVQPTPFAQPAYLPVAAADT